MSCKSADKPDQTNNRRDVLPLSKSMVRQGVQGYQQGILRPKGAILNIIITLEGFSNQQNLTVDKRAPYRLSYTAF